jgi:hypothetical protein
MFYTFLDGPCSNPQCRHPIPPIEKVYGEFDFQFLYSLSRGAGSMRAGSSDMDAFARNGNLQQSPGYGWGSGLISPNQFTDAQFSGGFGGGSMNCGGWKYMASRLKLRISTCITSLGSPLQTIQELIQTWKCSFAFAFAVILSLLISLHSYGWVTILFSRLAVLLTSLSIPFFGIIVMSFAFCVHRSWQDARPPAETNILALQHPWFTRDRLDRIFHDTCRQISPSFSPSLPDYELALRDRY